MFSKSEPTSTQSSFEKNYAYVPLWVFLAAYIFTCLIGSVLVLINYHPFIAEYELGTGTLVPKLTSLQVWQNLSLLFLAPALLCVGYIFTYKYSFLTRFIQNKIPLYLKQPISVSPLWANAIFYSLAFIALTHLIRAGSFASLGDWLDYGQWVLARWQMFENIGFFAFVNIYTLVPISAVLVFLTAKPTSRIEQCLRWLPFVITVFIEMLVFQRKSVMLMEFIAITSTVAFLAKDANNIPFIKKLACLAPIIMLATYLVLLLIPMALPGGGGVANQITSDKMSQLAAKGKNFSTLEKDLKQYTKNSNTDKHQLKHSPVMSEPNKDNKNIKIGTPVKTTPSSNHIISTERLSYISHLDRWGWMQHAIALSKLSIMAPLGRTSVPSLYYPTVFPEQHAFYGLYYGQNIFGYGHMPDDNVVVWHYMKPGIPGAITAPFHFVLYSQVGLLGALCGSLLMGCLLAFAWKIAQNEIIPQPWASLFSSMVLMLALYISIDALHNSVLVSYGVSWGLFFILGMWIIFQSKAKLFATFKAKSTVLAS